ncbi:MAG TPA: GNAT family N-acetyltransferase [Aggregatilineales bacterium]|nr:GNAT family N-acetyltransferase [Aggregatilineales bacterium]
MELTNIEIRALSELDELAQVEAIQQVVWPDPTATVYRNFLLNMVRNGALVLGALEDKKIIGFLLSYLGIESPGAQRPAMANLKLVSQRMAILPAYRDRGIGYELKLAQRRFAIEQGIRLITWTYDPLLARNAHLNIRKLGGIVHDYWRDFYGTAPSAHVTLGSSDRLLVEWWVTGNRVEQRMTGKRGGLVLEQYTSANATVLNPTTIGALDLPRPAERIVRPQGMVALVEIPEDFHAIIAADQGLARAWRGHSRGIIEQTLASGYTITDFVRGSFEGRSRAFYALSMADAPSSGFSPN